jgi:hypothetical protein
VWSVFVALSLFNELAYCMEWSGHVQVVMQYIPLSTEMIKSRFLLSMYVEA